MTAIHTDSNSMVAPAHFRPEFDPKYQTGREQINSLKIPLLKIVNVLKSK